MRLEEVARGRYRVLALWVDDQCPLRDGLKEIQAKHGDLYQQSLAVLVLHLPHNGPRFYRRSTVSIKTVRHYGITEIRLGGRPDPAVRILWFYDDEDEPAPRRIVCVDAYWKMNGECSGNAPAGDRLPAASRLKEIYIDLKSHNQIEVMKVQGDLP